MSAPIVDLAEQVKNLINTPGAFTPALAATRTWQLLTDLPQLTTAKFTVFGITDKTVERVDREQWKHEMIVDIAVQQKLADDADAAKDALVAQADAINEYVKANWAESSAYELMTATTQVVVNNELLKVNRLFTSAVRLAFWNFR
jgi:hypothetical protein